MVLNNKLTGSGIAQDIEAWQFRKAAIIKLEKG